MAYNSRNTQIRGAVLIAVVAIALILAVLTLNSVVLNNVGNVKAINIEIYWESERANEVSLIDWDIIEPGTTKNVTVYILNTGNSNVLLSMNATNWSPSTASSYITPSWDYKGQHMLPGQLLKITLMLAMSPTIQGITSFSYDIVITGTG